MSTSKSFLCWLEFVLWLIIMLKGEVFIILLCLIEECRYRGNVNWYLKLFIIPSRLVPQSQMKRISFIAWCCQHYYKFSVLWVLSCLVFVFFPPLSFRIMQKALKALQNDLHTFCNQTFFLYYPFITSVTFNIVAPNYGRDNRLDQSLCTISIYVQYSAINSDCTILNMTVSSSQISYFLCSGNNRVGWVPWPRRVSQCGVLWC